MRNVHPPIYKFYFLILSTNNSILFWASLISLAVICRAIESSLWIAAALFPYNDAIVNHLYDSIKSFFTPEPRAYKTPKLACAVELPAMATLYHQVDASFGLAGTPKPENNCAPYISCAFIWFDSAAILNQYTAVEWSGGFLVSNAKRPNIYCASGFPAYASSVSSFFLVSKFIISSSAREYIDLFNIIRNNKKEFITTNLIYLILLNITPCTKLVINKLR